MRQSMEAGVGLFLFDWGLDLLGSSAVDPQFEQGPFPDEFQKFAKIYEEIGAGLDVSEVLDVLTNQLFSDCFIEPFS